MLNNMMQSEERVFVNKMPQKPNNVSPWAQSKQIAEPHNGSEGLEQCCEATRGSSRLKTFQCYSSKAVSSICCKKTSPDTTS
jgi:hypothetical protein